MTQPSIIFQRKQSGYLNVLNKELA